MAAIHQASRNLGIEKDEVKSAEAKLKKRKT